MEQCLLSTHALPIMTSVENILACNHTMLIVWNLETTSNSASFCAFAVDLGGRPLSFAPSACFFFPTYSCLFTYRTLLSSYRCLPTTSVHPIQFLIRTTSYVQNKHHRPADSIDTSSVINPGIRPVPAASCGRPPLPFPRHAGSSARLSARGFWCHVCQDDMLQVSQRRGRLTHCPCPCLRSSRA